MADELQPSGCGLSAARWVSAGGAGAVSGRRCWPPTQATHRLSAAGIRCANGGREILARPGPARGALIADRERHSSPCDHLLDGDGVLGAGAAVLPGGVAGAGADGADAVGGLDILHIVRR